MDSLANFPMKLASALFALAMILAALNTPKDPPASELPASAQLEFPFIAESPALSPEERELARTTPAPSWLRSREMLA